MGIVQRQSLWLTVISYGGAVLGVINKGLLFTNFLSTDQVGLTNVLTTVAILYAQVAALGIVNVGMRFFPYFENREKKHNGFLFWGNCIILGGFLITMVVFLLFKPYVVKNFRDQSPMLVEYYSYLIPLAFAMLYFQFFDSYLRAILKTIVATFLNEIFVRVLQTICVSLYAFKLIDFHQFVILYIISYFALTMILVVYMVYLKQFHIMPVKSKLFKRMFRAIIVYGAFTVLSSLGAAILKSIDSIMVAGMLDLSKAGIYTVIFTLPAIITMPYRSIQRTTYPLIARFWKKRDTKSIYELYHRTTLITMIIGGILLIGMWTNLGFIFSFMPKAYSDGSYVFLFLAIATYVDMVTGLNGVILVTSKKYKYDFWFLMLLVVLTIVMNLVFIPLYGITGAAMATSLSLIIYNIARSLFVQYFFKMQPFDLKCFWVLVITLLTWLSTLLFPHIENKYINLIVCSAIITILYGGAVLLLKLSPDVNNLVYKYTKLKFLLPKESITSN